MNVVGFVEGERGQGTSVRLGMGAILRRLVRALERAGTPFSIVPYRPAFSEVAVPPQTLRDHAPYDTNLICLNADYLGHLLADAGAAFFRDRVSIGVWFWETSRFSLDARTPVACLDEVWVASSYVRDAVAAQVDLPVFVAPIPMEQRSVTGSARSELGLPDGFLFLYSFNFLSAPRKNPTAVVDAFTRAFAPGEGPVLVLKSVNGRERKPALLAELKLAARGRPDVVVVDRYISEDESRAMIASCDCYVSLHRSEGFGLTMAEAIELGKPVIATAYSGNLEFMDEGSSYLVPARLVDVPSSWWAFTPGSQWAEPDVFEAATLMRRVWENPEEARARGEQARVRLLERFTVERTIDFMSSRFADLQARGRRRNGRPVGEARTAILRASELLLSDVGENLARGRGSPVKSSVRRTLRRVLWPYLRQQQELDVALLHATLGLQRSMEDLEQRLAELGSRSELEIDEPD